MRNSPRHVRDSGHEDVVTRRAAELRVTTEEVFARAFAEAGKSRSASNAAFGRYCRKETQYEVPLLVQEYCEKTLRNEKLLELRDICAAHSARKIARESQT